MLDSDILRSVRLEVARQLNTILSGQAGANDTVQGETIDNMYPGSPSIPDRPVMHPYGFASRAAKGTISVTGKQGSDPTNRLVLGHRDKMRPTDISEGDVVIYSSDGKTVLTRVDVSQQKGFKVTTKFGFFEWDAVSDMNFDTGTVAGQIGHGGKVKLTNAAGELVSTLLDIAKSLKQIAVDVKTGTTATMLGPQPLVMPTIDTDLAALDAQILILTAFKG